jgi:hypothetical protein
VWRILKWLGLNRLPDSQRDQRRTLRWKHNERQRTGHQLQLDVKFIEPLGQTGREQKYHQFPAIDCTRPRVLRAYLRCDQKTAIALVNHTSPSCRSRWSGCKSTFKLGVALKIPGLYGQRGEDRRSPAQAHRGSLTDWGATRLHAFGRD